MNDRERWQRAVELFDRGVRGLALLGGAVLVFMMGLTVIDVGLRKLANAPIFGAQNVSELALLVVVFCALAHCGRVRGHIAVDLIGSVAGPRLLRVTDAFVNLLGAAVFVVLAWRAVVAAEHAMAIGRVSNLLAIPHWPFYTMIALGSGLYVIAQLIDAVRAASGSDAGGDGGS